MNDERQIVPLLSSYHSYLSENTFLQNFFSIQERKFFYLKVFNLRMNTISMAWDALNSKILIMFRKQKFEIS